MTAPTPHTATMSLVPYQTPRARATQATGHAAIGVFAAVGAVAIPILLNFLSHPDYSRAGLTTLGTVVGAALLGLLLTFCVSYSHATGSDVLPSIPPRPVYVPPGSPVPFVQPPRMPPIIDPVLVTRLIEEALRGTLPQPTTLPPAPDGTQSQPAPPLVAATAPRATRNPRGQFTPSATEPISLATE